MTTIINGSSPSITFSDGSAQTSATRPFLNRIINGAMVIDQRNAGASVTLDGSESFITDRFACGDVTDGTFTGQRVTDAPAGFINSLKCTVTSADTSLAATQTAYIKQPIEGLNITDLAWGTVNAKTVTLSFWVKSSLTGTFGGSLRNSGASRSYPFSYTISVADTWEYKTVTIAGDTSGTWLTTNGVGIDLGFSLGAGSDRTGTAGAWNANNNTGATGQTQIIGTNGATFYITGVQLEVGSTATSFDYRPYGTELALCQRYYYRIGPVASQDTFGNASADSATVGIVISQFPVTMRTAPSALEQSGTATDYVVRTGGTSRTCSAVPTYDGGTSENIWHIQTTVASGQTAGQAGFLRAAAVTTAYLGWSAEL
jgi:hypothetical protein